MRTKTASQRLRELVKYHAKEHGWAAEVTAAFAEVIKQVEFLEKSVERQIKELGQEPHDPNG